VYRGVIWIVAGISISFSRLQEDIHPSARLATFLQDKSQLVRVRARRSTSRAAIPSSVTKRMQLSHITIETSHGPVIAAELGP
jgi:hypothetical protein